MTRSQALSDPRPIPPAVQGLSAASATVFLTGTARAQPSDPSWAPLGSGVNNGKRCRGTLARRMSVKEGATMHSWSVSRLVAVAAVAAPIMAVSGQTFRPVGFLAGDVSQVHGVAEDGTGVVTAEAAFDSRAALSLPSGELQDLGTLGGEFSEGGDLSADGLVAVGGAETTAGRLRPFRWTASGGMQDLGHLGGQTGFATATDAPGAVVAGWSFNSSGQETAFRWTTEAGMIGLGTFGGTRSMSLGVSGDGFTVVGWARLPSGSTRAFAHTAPGGLMNLGTLEGGGSSQAEGASADASIIVGSAIDRSGTRRPVRWSQGVIAELAPLPDGFEGTAQDVSADGSRIVGQGEDSGFNRRAVLWTAADTPRDLTTLFADVIPDGWILEMAESISADGRFIAGRGTNPQGDEEGWVIDTGCRADFDGNGTVNSDDLFAYLTAYFAGAPEADFDGKGGVNSNDFFLFLTTFFGGCS